ncbi:MAG: hypothetical protein R3E14_11680 [Erythrobacter sp.]
MTNFETDDDFARLATSVLDASLPHGEWTHEAHFALALWMLRHRPEGASPQDFRRIIMRLNDAHGTPNTDNSGYHHTITIASIEAARSCLSRHDGNEPLAHVLKSLVDGPCGRSGWILAYWSRDRLFSVAARRDWVEPDLQTLSFGD